MVEPTLARRGAHHENALVWRYGRPDGGVRDPLLLLGPEGLAERLDPKSW